MTLAVHSQGEGPGLTLVHGWGLGSGAWALPAHLLAKHFTVHVADLPGYGVSAPQPEASLEDLADALAATLPPRAMLCGWSLGAQICLLCAQRHPRSVARLVLVGATASFLSRPAWDAALPVEQLGDFINRLEADPAALLKHFASLIHHGDARGRDALRALRGCLAEGLPADAATLRAGLGLLGSNDLRPALAEIKQPALLIHGDADPLMPLAAAQRLAGLLADAQLDVFEGSAHAPFASDPVRFVEAVCRFAGIEP
ncbi:MAG TPA: alpha/beta fold hydrolase [Rhodocyclaceae bacterium]